MNEINSNSQDNHDNSYGRYSSRHNGSGDPNRGYTHSDNSHQNGYIHNSHFNYNSSGNGGGRHYFNNKRQRISNDRNFSNRHGNNRLSAPQNLRVNNSLAAEGTAAVQNAAVALSNATNQNLTAGMQGDLTLNAAAPIVPEPAVVIDESDPYLPFRGVFKGYWNDPTILQNKLLATVSLFIPSCSSLFFLSKQTLTQFVVKYTKFPSEKDALQKLPPYKYEEDFKERLRQSYSIVVQELQADLARPMPAASSSDDDYGSDEDYDRDRMVLRPTATTGDSLLARRELLQKVAEHPAVHFGFQCLAEHEFDKWCRCPMGEKWGLVQPHCNHDSRLRPKELMDHLNKLAGQGMHNEHGVVRRFLECLYGNVYQDDKGIKYPHEAVAKNEEQRRGFQRLRAKNEYR
jgi:hypothetical protein